MVYIENSIGESTDPCGTPYLVLWRGEICSCILTVKLRSLMKLENHCRHIPLIPISLNLDDRMLRSIVSDAADKSRKIHWIDLLICNLFEVV